jgi:hypothetical protein
MKTRLLLITLSSLVLVSFADAQTATTVAAFPLGNNLARLLQNGCIR